MPTEQLLTQMGQYNEELCSLTRLTSQLFWCAGSVFRHQLNCDRWPFTVTKELVAGYWLWQVNSMEEAISDVKCNCNYITLVSIIEIVPSDLTAVNAGLMSIAVNPNDKTHNCSGCGHKVPKTIQDR
jgi:hypothetical protein